MNETSKASLRRNRDSMFGSRFFVGSGIDIGGGLDSLGKQITQFPRIKSVRNWDMVDGDAQYLNGVSDEIFDFVYSSHCLEHMQDPVIALKNWLRVLKPGGYLVVSIPDEDMYEHGVWPSRFNRDHKWSFTIYKDCPEMPKSINVIDLAKDFSSDAECERISRIKDGYVEGGIDIDQTLGGAECAIEFVWKKQKPKLERVMPLADHYEKRGQDQKAIDIYTRVIQEAPLNFDTYNRLANLLARKGCIADAENIWNICIKNLPELHIARMYQSLFLISIGKYDQGFQLRDALVSDERRTSTAPPTAYPKWQGESLKQKSIVIWTEFGFGDEIMFARFASVLKDSCMAKRVSIVCQKPLLTLLKTIQNVDLVISEQEVAQLPAHDYWVFPHSIPARHSLEKNGIPAAIPYLRIPNGELAKASKLLPKKRAGRMRVGLVTKGNPTHENDQLRSIANLGELLELFELPGIDWVNLQKSNATSEFDQVVLPQNISIVHLGEQLTDFLRTGAICSQLDLVICVDTSVAHLAGALNIPTWLMLPAYADWRWGINQSSSLWYPSMKIFRQEYVGNWGTVIRDIRIELCKKIQETSLQSAITA